MTRSTGYPAFTPAGTSLLSHARRPGTPGCRAYREAEGCPGSPDGPAAVRATALLVEVGMDPFAKHGDAQTIIDEHHDYEVNP